MKKVFHFVPSMAIGGVEIAIEKSLPELRRKFDISIFYVKCHGSLNVGQLPWWSALRNIFVARPNVVISSLWWAHPLGLLFKLAGVKWVCFIHSTGLTHAFDQLISKAAILLSDVVVADSEQTVTFIHTIKKNVKAHVIPYIFPLEKESVKIKRRKNSFIFVGRSTPLKRIDLIVDFLKYFLVNYPTVTCRFVISGDIPKDVLSLKEFFSERVTVETDLSNHEVFYRLCASEYFLVLSDYEGFCMAANEAVQAGCFIIYRDVGEIKSYVLPKHSYKVVNMDNLFLQFAEVLKKRNDTHPEGVDVEEPKFQGEPEETYVSSFIALIDKLALP